MRKIIVLFVVLILATVLVSGCAAPQAGGDIKNPEDAANAVQNISQDVGDLSDTLDEIDQNLG